jgi:hypothetical protein
MMSIDPVQALQAGSAILSEVLEKYGFAFRFVSSGRGSGGNFASGEFLRGNRKLELHFRYDLGLVSYHLDSRSLSHEMYMLSVLGKRHVSRYPGFNSDPLDGFRDLRVDLEEYGTDFLSGTDTVFLAHFERAADLERQRPKIPL